MTMIFKNWTKGWRVFAIILLLFLLNTGVNAQKILTYDLKMGVGGMYNIDEAYTHSSFSWGMGGTFGYRFDRDKQISVGLHFSNNALYSTLTLPADREDWGTKSIDAAADVNMDEENIDQSEGYVEFVGVISGLTTMRMPIKAGIWKQREGSNLAFFANLGLSPELLLSRSFHYKSYSVYTKSSLGLIVLADTGIAIEWWDESGFLTLSGYCERSLINYKDRFTNNRLTRWGAGISIGALFVF